MSQFISLRKIQGSVFFKLLLIFVATTLLMAGIVKVLVTYVVDPHSVGLLTKNKNRAEYANLLTDQIGYPPNVIKAQELAERLGMQIAIEGEKISYASQSGIPTFANLTSAAHHCVWDKNFKVGVENGRVFIIVARGLTNYLFSFESDAFAANSPKLIPMLLTVFLFILFLTYMAIRWLFRPLTWLTEGVEQVKKGNMSFRVSTRKNDELGELARSFNEMTTQIADVLSSKERLLLDVSHELRSPITRIKVALELDGQKQKERIKKNVLDLEAMITELLESARLNTAPGVLKETETDLVSLIQSVVLDYTDVKTIAEQPDVLVKRAPESLTLKLDPLRVQTVIKNIVDNAMKCSSHQKLPVEIFVSGPINNQVFVDIQDHGFGIPKEDQPFIFEPFYRVDKSRVRDTGGYGLGLSLCKKIMRAHHGEIEISRSDETGTMIRLSFPDVHV